MLHFLIEPANVFVYYEIYNLKRDAFGQTKYRVEYTVRLEEGSMRGSIISRLAKTFTRKKREKVAVGYEQVGMEASERAYVEMDLEKSGPGRCGPRVEVTDLNSGETAAKETVFAVEKHSDDSL